MTRSLSPVLKALSCPGFSGGPVLPDKGRLPFGSLHLNNRGPGHFLMQETPAEPAGLFLDEGLLARHDDFVVREELFLPQFHGALMNKHQQMVDRLNQLFDTQPKLRDQVNRGLSTQAARDELRLYGVFLPFTLSERVFCGVRLCVDWMKAVLYYPFDKFSGEQRGFDRVLELAVGVFDLVALPVTLPLIALLGAVYGALSGLVSHTHPHHGNDPSDAVDENQPLPP